MMAVANPRPHPRGETGTRSLRHTFAWTNVRDAVALGEVGVGSFDISF
jgi:hypothetical protein